MNNIFRILAFFIFCIVVSCNVSLIGTGESDIDFACDVFTNQICTDTTLSIGTSTDGGGGNDTTMEIFIWDPSTRSSSKSIIINGAMYQFFKSVYGDDALRDTLYWSAPSNVSLSTGGFSIYTYTEQGVLIKEDQFENLWNSITETNEPSLFLVRSYHPEGWVEKDVEFGGMGVVFVFHYNSTGKHIKKYNYFLGNGGSSQTSVDTTFLEYKWDTVLVKETVYRGDTLRYSVLFDELKRQVDYFEYHPTGQVAINKKTFYEDDSVSIASYHMEYHYSSGGDLSEIRYLNSFFQFVSFKAKEEDPWTHCEEPLSVDYCNIP